MKDLIKIIPTNEHGIPFAAAPFVPFIAMFNPESFGVQEGIEWMDRCPPGAEGSDPQYRRTKAREFTIEFTLDGTGVNTDGVKIPVTLQVALFRTVTTKLDGLIHRPPYLLVQYGTFIINCVLKSSTVTYTLFDMFGLPIRAKISASFVERTPNRISRILSLLSSPDLTHKVTVKRGDLLPLLTHRVYNNQHYYLQVAKANRLKNFRNLQPESTPVLHFPPIADE